MNIRRVQAVIFITIFLLLMGVGCASTTNEELASDSPVIMVYKDPT